MNIIDVKNLKKVYDDFTVFEDVSFTVNRGEVVAVIGPSGAGKSTMLRCLIDLERADMGTVLIEGEALCKDGVYATEKEKKRVCRKMGMVFQNFNLFPHLNVMNNLIYAPVYVLKEKKEDAILRAKEMLKKVGLEDKESAMPGELSGGQKQRVAIARALMTSPDIILFDEPTSSLDPQLTGEVLSVIKSLAESKMTMIIVTHEMNFAKELADKVIFMADKKIVESGTADDIFNHPKDPKIVEFITSIL